jgi:cytochrome c peroxidase
LKTKVILHIAILIAFASSFISNAYWDFKPTPLPLQVPKGFPQPNAAIFKNNPITKEGFALGKKLFYDFTLSRDSQVSCASCHQQYASFSTYDHDFSHGIFDTHTYRNAPPLVNLAWMKSWHWDGAINHLANQPLAPFTAKDEMGETLENIVKKVKANKDYAPMFLNAFGTSNVNIPNITKALTQFTGSLVSANSTYDKVMRGEQKFNKQQEAGYAIFKTHCNGCHTAPLFTNNSFANNGISLNTKNDKGLMTITGQAKDSLSFKIPTLRNIGQTIPYMHDGRFNELAKVINHYTSLDSSLPNLHPLLRKKINLTDTEKQQLILFLFSLSDSSFTKNKLYYP